MTNVASSGHALGNSPKVLVAGVNGTLGRAAASKLASAGWFVEGVARGPGEFGGKDRLEEAVKGVQVQYGDLCETAVAQKVCADATGVLFAAGSSGVIASFADPVASLLGSAIPWLNVLRSCREGNRLVLLSSQLVYGMPKDEPFREDSVLRPESPYALHRVLMEDYGRLFALRNGYDVTVLRLGNVFGDIVDLDYPRNHGVVARMLRDLIRDGAAQLYGSGDQRLVLLHTEDVAEAVVAVMTPPPTPGRFSVYNLGGDSLSIREVANELSRGIGSGETICVPWDPGIERSMAKDMQLCDRSFREQYGWRPAKDVREALHAIARRYGRGAPG